MPNAPSVKYNGFIYPNEEECQVARYEFYEAYNKKSTDYKSITAIDAIGLEPREAKYILGGASAILVDSRRKPAPPPPGRLRPLNNTDMLGIPVVI